VVMDIETGNIECTVQERGGRLGRVLLTEHYLVFNTYQDTFNGSDFIRGYPHPPRPMRVWTPVVLLRANPHPTWEWPRLTSALERV
jgi:hypothetical protein